MCGRCSVGCSIDAICAAGGVARGAVAADVARSYAPSQNVAPNCRVPAVQQTTPAHPRELTLMFWGMRRGAPEDKSPLVNVMLETLRAGPGVQRCVVLVEGFYEWMKTPAGKVPFYFYHREGVLLPLACIYRREEEQGQSSKFSIVTTAAAKQVRWLHERQPVLLPAGLVGRWLDSSDSGVVDLLQKGSGGSRLVDDELVYHAVSTNVNNVQYAGQDCTSFVKKDTRPLTQFFKPQSPSPTKAPAIGRISSSSSSKVKPEKSSVVDSDNGLALDFTREADPAASASAAITSDSVAPTPTPTDSNCGGERGGRIFCPLCNLDITNLTAGSRNAHADCCSGPAASSLASSPGKRPTDSGAPAVGSKRAAVPALNPITKFFAKRET